MSILARSVAVAIWASWLCAHVDAEGDAIPDFMLDTLFGAQGAGEYVAPPSSGGVPMALWGKKTSQKERATKLCEVPPDDYRKMDHCHEDRIDEWRTKGKDGKWAWYDKAKGEIVVGNGFEKECKGKDKNIQREVDGVVEKFKCKEKCDSMGEVYRLGCCQVCLDRKQDKEPKKNKQKKKRVLDVECEGCEEDEMDRIFEANKEPFNCRKDDNGKIKCDTPGGKQCVTKDDVIVPEDDVCVATDCDGCPDDSAARAQCCLTCLEHSCGEEDNTDKDKKRVCTGCGEVLADETEKTPETTKAPKDPKDKDEQNGGGWWQDPVKIALIVLGVIILIIVVAALVAYLHKQNRAGRGGHGRSSGAHYGGRGTYSDDRFGGPAMPPPGHGGGYGYHHGAPPSSGYGGSPPSAGWPGGGSAGAPPSAAWQGGCTGSAPPSAMHPSGPGGYRSGGQIRPGQGVRVEMTVRR